MFIFIACMFIVLGLISIFFNVSHLPGRGGRDIEFYSNTESGYIFGVIQLSIGIIILIYGVRRNKKLGIIEFSTYSKCPECKESYDNLKLDDGKCPRCNIKTIDMDKYYE